MNVDSRLGEDLLEPFHRADDSDDEGSISQIQTCTMFRQGGIIVISSLEDSNSGLLECFPDRDSKEQIGMSMASLQSVTDDEEEDKLTRRGTSLRKDSIKAGFEVFESLLSTIPNERFRNARQKLLDSITARRKVIKPTEARSEVLATLNDAAQFRKLKEQMKSAHVITGGGAKYAISEFLGSSAPPRSPLPSRKPCRHNSPNTRAMSPLPPSSVHRFSRSRSNSINGCPSNEFGDGCSSLGLQDRNSSLTVNISPFADSTN